MPYPAPTKRKTSATIPHKKIKTDSIESTEWHGNIENTEWRGSIEHILHLPGGQRVITYSDNGSFRVWDLETGTQVGEEWEDKEIGVQDIAISPDGKTVASGSSDGAVRLWNIDTGKVIKKWTEHKMIVRSVCWSPDGRRVVSGSEDEVSVWDVEGGFKDATFRIWDVESGATILGPIKAGKYIHAVCYSPPDAKMIATSGDRLNSKVWDANTGKLLTTLEGFVTCLVWTSDGKTLVTGGFHGIRTFDTATWTETVLVERLDDTVHSISLSPNERILASTLWDEKTVQLWNLETNQPIRTLHHEDWVTCAVFSADGMFLTTSCLGMDGPMYIWDISAIVKEVGLLFENRPAPKIKGARQIPPGFFDSARCADLSCSCTQSHGQYNPRTPLSRQRMFSSFWRRHSDQREKTEHGTQSWSIPFSWTRNLVSGVLHRRDGSDIKLREPPIVEVPCTAGKPRNYHARKKRFTSPSRPSNTRTQQHTATQGTSSSSQQPPPTATSTASILPAVAGAAGTVGTISHPHSITITGWPARLMAWVCCMPIQSAN